MAVYKIFPEKDSTIYSLYPSLNTGVDEIIELLNNKIDSEVSNYSQISRILIKFPTSEISSLMTNYISSSNFDVYTKLYLADGFNLLDNYTIELFPISGSWEMGFGKYSNIPTSSWGSSWKWRDYSGSRAWISSSLSSYTTSSYVNNFTGGGIWYTGSNSVNLKASQSFNYIDSKDVEIKVTNIIHSINSSSINNEGFILKLSDNIEFNSSSLMSLKFYSMDTHTIYPPCLEFRWNDYSYNIGSGSTVESDDIIVSLNNNKNEYEQNSIQKFRINVRDRFPNRAFQTSSVYLNNKFLTTSSYWCIKDLDTDEVIVDFDSIYTKISADTTSSYFNVYMNGLEPERYYKFLFKTIVNDSTLILDDKCYFKVIK